MLININLNPPHYAVLFMETSSIGTSSHPYSHFTLAVLFTIAISRREVDLIIGRKFEFIYNDGI